jgi:hypothetical protein
MHSDLPFPELQRRSLINVNALQADQAANFSQRIRADLPLPASQ